MEYNIHTDLAIESGALAEKSENTNIRGVRTNSYGNEFATVTHVEIINKDGEDVIGKPVGNYVTVEVPKIRENITEAFESAENMLTEELKKMIKTDEKPTVLVAGLGNRFVTPDALGPKVVDRLLVTRHLKDVLPKDFTDNMLPLCAIAPGVLGITGIETGEIIRAVTDKIHPDIIIAIDALASRKTSRISTTFQIADTGIVPGSGIGNKRHALTKETLGVPVIAIGVPTVIYAASVANDAIDLLTDAIKANSDPDSQIFKAADAFGKENKYNLISEILSPDGKDFIVTPKEVDSIVDEVSKIIASGINNAVNGDVADKLGEIL